MVRTFEEYNEYRDVNLVQFFVDFEKYKHLIEGSVISNVKNMLIGKKVEFQDSVMRSRTSGTVKKINYNVTKGHGVFKTNEFLSIYFEEDKNTHTFSLKDKSSRQQKFNTIMKNRAPYIKIWHSEITSIEKQIDMIKGAEKYNI